MKRMWLAVASVIVLLGSDPGAAQDEYSDAESHPLRIVAYALHPAGYTLEWLVFRPFHSLVSQPQLEPIFGHYPHGEWGYYRVTEAARPAEGVNGRAEQAAVRAEDAAKQAADSAREAKEAVTQAKAEADRAEKAAGRAEAAAEKSEATFEKALKK